jgi:hypothetical protein
VAEEGENSNYLSGFLDLLNEKRESAEPGVVKDSAGKVSPTLTPGEVGRYKNIFKIMKDVVDPNPEAADLESTKAGKVGKTSQIKEAATGGGDGGGNMAMGGILALVAAAGLLAAYLKDLKERLQDIFGKGNVEGTEYIIRGLNSLRGIFGMLNILGKIFKPLVKGFDLLKNSKAFKSLGGAAAKVIKVGSKIGKAAGSLFKIIGKVGKTIGKKLKFIPFLGSIFNFMTAYEEFQKGNYIRAGLELLAGVLNLIPGIGNVAGSAINGVLLIYDLMSSNEQGKDLRDMLGNPGEKLKALVAPIIDKIVGFFKGIGEWLIEGAGAMADLIKKGLKKFLPDLFVDNEPTLEEKRNQDWNASQQMKQQARDRRMTPEEQRADAILNMTPRELKYFKKTNVIMDGKITDEMLKSVGAEVDDGIIYRNGKATRIDGQDSLLAAKPGGPIDKMLDQNRGIQTQQLKVLLEIRDGINALKSSGGMSFSNNSLTQEFFA